MGTVIQNNYAGDWGRASKLESMKCNCSDIINIRKRTGGFYFLICATSSMRKNGPT